jgi:hypothetical protein
MPLYISKKTILNDIVNAYPYDHISYFKNFDDEILKNLKYPNEILNYYKKYFVDKSDIIHENSLIINEY